MKYLSVEDILQIHSFIIDETRGSHGVRDTGALLALEALPKQQAFGHVLYPDIFTKSAVYVRNIILAHPFIDGNKRTGMTAAVVFLEDNGFSFRAAEGMVEAFALRVVEQKLELKDIAVWLKRYSAKKS